MPLLTETRRVRAQLRSAALRLFDLLASLMPVALRSALSRKLAAGLPAAEQFRLGKVSMASGLVQLARNGYSPQWIIDVGAHKGEWASLAGGIFPKAQLMMVEADPEWEPQLRDVTAALAGRARFSVSLLGPEPKAETLFYSMGMGSSVMEELTTAPREHKRLPMQTLDALLAASGVAIAEPLLLKLDVQGYELEVLKGATRTLAAADVLIAEVSLLEYNRGAPLVAEVIAFLDQRGLVPYDIAGMVRRHEDAALFQLDMIFVRKEHQLRARRQFWKGI